MTMKKIVYLTLIMLFVIVLGACAKATPQSVNEMINPGDKIGDFLITTGDEGDVTYGWEMNKCVHQDDKKINLCPTTVGAKVNVSLGVYDDTFKGKVDSLWLEHSYEMFIEDRPVNLQAFGYIDVTHPMVGKMRYWNIVITTTKSGEIIVAAKGVVGGDPFEDTTTFSFSAP
jgi:hypothetical protein